MVQTGLPVGRHKCERGRERNGLTLVAGDRRGCSSLPRTDLFWLRAINRGGDLKVPGNRTLSGGWGGVVDK